MYNSLTNRRTTTTPLMGINNLSKSWYPTAKSGFHTEMNGFLTLHTAAPIGAKCFDNPNFVNGNNPSLLRHQDFYHPPVTKFCKKSPVEAPPPPPSPPPPPEMKMKKKRKRKRRNRRKNKKTTNHNQIVKTDEFPMPELTKSFKDISVEQPELARPRLPSVCESEDSFIVFDDGVADNNNDDDDDGQESAIESDIEVVFEESTEVSENEGMSSDSYTPRKKVSRIFIFRHLLFDFFINRNS